MCVYANSHYALVLWSLAFVCACFLRFRCERWGYRAPLEPLSKTRFTCSYISCGRPSLTNQQRRHQHTPHHSIKRRVVLILVVVFVVVVIVIVVVLSPQHKKHALA